MIEQLIAFFARRHFLTNFLMFAVFVGGISAWHSTSKEEWPDITMDTVRVSVTYPGAPAEDVEYFVTKEIEEEVRGLDGVRKIISSSSVGQSSVTVELEPNYPKVDEAVTEIRNAVLDVDLPDEVIDDPVVRVFKSSKKAILDIGIIFKDVHLLSVDQRRRLQQVAYALENQLMSLPQVNSVEKDGYLQEELQIKAYPEQLKKFDIPFNTVMNQIRANNVRKPAGTIEAKSEPKVTLDSELDTPEKLKALIIQGGFEGKVIRLGDVAEVHHGYEKNKSIMKINGHEGVMFSVVKNSSYGILDSINAVTKRVERFKKMSLEGSPVDLILLDDETIDLRNRLSIISSNGLIGFVLIIGMLFAFLNKQSGVWVAMGIPFTICFTLIAGSLMGYTINGTTLAAVIIVMGMIVDDAIVVAENVTRLVRQGVETSKAVIKGTAYVTLPIIASIVTTCIAFVPLFFFSGRFGKFVMFIPPIIFLMLFASLLESLFILPGHLDLKLPLIGKLSADKAGKKHWFDRFEEKYAAFLEKALVHKYLILAGFCLLLVVSLLIGRHAMKFVMFPNEETRDIVVSGYAPAESDRVDTAVLTGKIEDILKPYIGKEVVGFRNEIARSRRGGAVEENRFRMIIEIVPKEKRKKSADRLIKEFEAEIKKIEGLEKLMFQKSRWGQDSGNAIELIVQQNDDRIRAEVTERLKQAMQDYGRLQNIEVDEGLRVPEYKVEIDREKIKRLSIGPEDIASTFRAALEGTVLYEFTNGDEDVRARFTIVDAAKDDIEKVLDLPVENQGNYLVPLRDVVSVRQVVSPNAIARQDLRRTTIIDAGIQKNGRVTPLEVAEHFEENIFPEILVEYPSTSLSFGGEILDTRESQSDFGHAVTLALLLIYSILAILFHSLLKPLIIMLAIPFGVVGIILAFCLHGKFLFGFYSAVGALGLAGVVINDAIIMLTKLESGFDASQGRPTFVKQIAEISSTRLRAVMLTTLTTIAGLIPTAYGFAGYDAMLAEMMLSMAWGLLFGTFITLLLIPCVYNALQEAAQKWPLLNR